MPKKKRMLVTSIVIAGIVVIIVIAACIGLYMTTDLFKSNRELFVKYAAGTFSNINKLFNDDNMNEMQQVFHNNKYEVKSNTDINYQEGENKENPINNIKLVVNGKIEESQSYDYQDISLRNKENEKIYGIEYLKSNNKYGIRFNGIQQFATEDIGGSSERKEGSLLNELARTSVGENEINILKFISEMSFRNTKIELTEQENITLQNKYINILNKNVSEDKFSQKQKMIVEVNGKKISANAYSITLTKEQLNNIYIEMLTQLKQDEIILSKLEEIDTLKHQYNVMINSKNQEYFIKDKFIKEIDDKIKEIQDTNIGSDIRKIIVFESNMQPIGIQIESNESTILITTNETDNSISYEYLKQKTTEKENTVNFKIEKISNINDDSISMEYNVVRDNVKTTNYLVKNMKFDKDTAKTTIEIARKNENAEIKINSQKEEKVVNEFKNKLEFNEKNSVNIDKISEEQKDNINNIMKEVNDKQIEKVIEVVSREDVNNVLEKLGLKLEEADDISGDGSISETERNRFNSNFEFYEGKKIPKENILKLIDVAKNNLEDIRVTKYKEQKNGSGEKEPEPEEYKLTIKKNKSNETLANNLATNIKNSKDGEYNVRIEYSQKTGLVENIFITVSK